jgi:hypothetical protein
MKTLSKEGSNSTLPLFRMKREGRPVDEVDLALHLKLSRKK